MFTGMRVQATKKINSQQGVVQVGTIGKIDEILTSWGKGVFTLSVNFEGFANPVVTGENKIEVIVYTSEERAEFQAKKESRDWMKKGTEDLMKQLGW